MEDVADMLGFKSKNAKDFIINCGDHHLSWQIISIIYEAFSKELIYNYLINTNADNVSPVEYVNWRNEKVINPNYNFYYDLVFNLLLGLKCFRAGIRKNNSDYAMAGRQKAAPIMFIGKHIIYKSLILNDMKLCVEAPAEVRNFINQNESFSRSGGPCRGEGGDYITETENKHLKSHLPPGVPTVNSWIKASRNHAILTKNRDAVFTKASLKDPGSSESSIFKFEEEVQMLRVVIRDSGILLNPLEEFPLKSLSGKVLHPSLVNFYFIASENYKNFKKDQSYTMEPVFVTYEDESDYLNVKNWTNVRLHDTIKKDIQKLESDSNEKYKSLYLRMKNARKGQLIELYEEIQQLVDNSSEFF